MEWECPQLVPLSQINALGLCDIGVGGTPPDNCTTGLGAFKNCYNGSGDGDNCKNGSLASVCSTGYSAD